jgi:hemoglobin
MKKDIESHADLEMLLWDFYKKAFNDELIGHFFTKVVPLDLETHVPIIADFWESVLLDGKNYRKNVMEIHQDINKKSPMQKQHFDRWVKLFTESVDKFFSGPKATMAKQRALSIATMMNIKMMGKTL